MNQSVTGMWNLIKKHGFLIYAVVMAINIVAFSIPKIIRYGITRDLPGHIFVLFLLLFSLGKWLDVIGRKRLGNAMVFASLIPGIGGTISFIVFRGAHILIPLAVISVFFFLLLIAGKILDRDSSRGR